VSNDCPFCGEDHGPQPVGEPEGPFCGLVFPVCPRIPPDHLYEDRQFEIGPRGLLHRIIPEAN
jgi:hypothetical protein